MAAQIDPQGDPMASRVHRRFGERRTQRDKSNPAIRMINDDARFIFLPINFPARNLDIRQGRVARPGSDTQLQELGFDQRTISGMPMELYGLNQIRHASAACLR